MNHLADRPRSMRAGELWPSCSHQQQTAAVGGWHHCQGTRAAVLQLLLALLMQGMPLGLALQLHHQGSLNGTWMDDGHGGSGWRDGGTPARSCHGGGSLQKPHQPQPLAHPRRGGAGCSVGCIMGGIQAPACTWWTAPWLSWTGSGSCLVRLVGRAATLLLQYLTHSTAQNRTATLFFCQRKTTFSSRYSKCTASGVETYICVYTVCVFPVQTPLAGPS